MTENDEIKIKCHRIGCYGVVKEYELDGPRNLPAEVKRKYFFRVYLNKIRRFLGLKPKNISWHECSMCHEYHPEMDE